MTNEHTEFTVQLKDTAPRHFPSVTYNCVCPGCGREIVVTAAINGSNHNIGVWAACKDCGAIAKATVTQDAARATGGLA